MIPVVPVAQACDAVVKSEGDITTVCLGKRTFTYSLNATIATCDGVKITLPLAPFSYSGVVYVPLRALITSLGGTLSEGTDPSIIAVALPGIATIHAPIAIQRGNPWEMMKCNDDVFLIKTDGTSVAQISYSISNDYNVQFSTDGSSLLSIRVCHVGNRFRSDILRRSLDQPQSVNLTPTHGKAHISYSNLTPCLDGAILCTRMIENRNASDVLSDIYRLLCDGLGWQCVAKSVVCANECFASADGKRLAYGTYGSPNKPKIHIMNSDGTNNRAVAIGNIQTLSADGNEIVYSLCSKDAPYLSCVALNVMTGKPIFSALHDAHIQNGSRLCFSPNGTALVYCQQEGGICLLKIDNSPPCLLDKEPGDGMPKFSPNSVNIAFIRDNSLYIMLADGSHIMPLAKGLHLTDFSFSPDGTQIVATGHFAGM